MPRYKTQAEKVHQRLSQDLPIGSVVSVAIVADPYSTTGEKIQVLRSTRDDPLAWMHSHDQIDDAQLAAGRKWQFLHECSTIGVIRAVDPAKEVVDGGRLPEMLTDRQIKAFQQLTESYEALEPFVRRVMFTILAERKPIADTARVLGYGTERGAQKIGRVFKGGLEKLAKLWGYA